MLEASLDHGTGTGIGHLSSDGTAHAALVTDGRLLADHPESPALEDLRGRIASWQRAGAPRTHELPAGLVREGDAWQARISAAQPESSSR
ncbi:hypothetical protein PJ985_06885 [Streptomyces sp. ACA25]|uniref:hypothetical protein n=1 Tax=Streptomyces sp. ACA25 TaxID=3022596 RepID=UPI0023080659|nr:hypothetical protein [Streptomyces sp. ACA25]MDB1087292.1 hypothetical protein [Streptomyces sp. ACA25]